VNLSRSVAGSTVLVTGAASGMGRATAEVFAAEGAHVAVTDVRHDTVREIADDLVHRGYSAEAFDLDVGDAAQIKAVVDAVAQRFGGLDILINNAGVGLFADVADMEAAAWHQVIDTNLTGVFFCCHAAIPALRQRGGGWIVNISSLAGTHPFKSAAAYCASKAGLNAFTEALMLEVRHDNIRVSCVAPGSVATGFMRDGEQAGWKLAPDDVAQVVLDLLAHPARSLPSRVELRPSKPLKR
jgi:3-oxoacyl-[acyl-carrier protein] reductase